MIALDNDGAITFRQNGAWTVEVQDLKLARVETCRSPTSTWETPADVTVFLKLQWRAELISAYGKPDKIACYDEIALIVAV